VQWACARWTEETQDAYKKERDPGQEQADKLTPKLYELREWWEKEWQDRKSLDG